MDDSAFKARLAETGGARSSARSRRLLALDPRPARSRGPRRLVEAMRYAALGGGKRLRPFLVIETARALGRADEGPVRAGRRSNACTPIR